MESLLSFCVYLFISVSLCLYICVCACVLVTKVVSLSLVRVCFIYFGLLTLFMAHWSGFLDQIPSELHCVILESMTFPSLPTRRVCVCVCRCNHLCECVCLRTSRAKKICQRHWLLCNFSVGIVLYYTNSNHQSQQVLQSIKHAPSALKALVFFIHTACVLALTKSRTLNFSRRRVFVFVWTIVFLLKHENVSVFCHGMLLRCRHGFRHLSAWYLLGAVA